MTERDDTSSLELKELQEDRVRDEARSAREADRPAEARTHQRRADKASYLRKKLAEAERADREAGVDPAPATGSSSSPPAPGATPGS